MEFIFPAILMAFLVGVLLCVIGFIFWLLVFRRNVQRTRKRIIAALLISLPLFVIIIGLPLLGAYSEAHWIFIDEPLFTAVEDGDVARVNHLLSRGANPSMDFEGYPALEQAASDGNVEIVRLLLEHGADVNVRNAWTGHTPLMSAKENHHEKVVKLLLDAGALH